MSGRKWQTFVRGVPRPQGSMTLARDPRTGREFARYSGPTYEWRQTLHIALSRWWGRNPPLEGAIRADFDFVMPRPQAHYGAKGIKLTAPVYHTRQMDLDKLARAVDDGLTHAGVWRDDGQVARLVLSKMFGSTPGVRIELEEL